MKAACFASMLHQAERGESQRTVCIVQVNQALPLLLDLLLERCLDAPGTLEVLLGHLPQSDLRCMLGEASETGYVSSQHIAALLTNSGLDGALLNCHVSATQVLQSLRAGRGQRVCRALCDVGTCSALPTTDG